MNINEVIERADQLRPNLIEAPRKAEWVYQLEADFAEMMGLDIPREKEYDVNDTEELLIGFPRDEVYVLYLCAKIDYAQEETTLYANDMTAANSMISDATAWWRRHNKPLKKHRFKGVYR